MKSTAKLSARTCSGPGSRMTAAQSRLRKPDANNQTAPGPSTDSTAPSSDSEFDRKFSAMFNLDVLATRIDGRKGFEASVDEAIHAGVEEYAQGVAYLFITTFLEDHSEEALRNPTIHRAIAYVTDIAREQALTHVAAERAKADARIVLRAFDITKSKVNRMATDRLAQERAQWGHGQLTTEPHAATEAVKAHDHWTDDEVLTWEPALSELTAAAMLAANRMLALRASDDALELAAKRVADWKWAKGAAFQAEAEIDPHTV